MIPPINVTVGCLRIIGDANKQGAWKIPPDEISRGVGISGGAGSKAELVVQQPA